MMNDKSVDDMDEPPNPETGFKAKLEGGHPTSYGEMNPFTGESALGVAYKTSTAVCELLAGKEGTRLRYYLAAQLLGGLDGWDWENLKEMVEMADGDPNALLPDWNPHTDRTTQDYPYDSDDDE